MTFFTSPLQSRFLLTVLLSAALASAQAQSSPKDSLWSVWKSGAADTTRLRAMSQLVSKFYGKQNPDSTLLLSDQQFALAEKIGSNYFMAEAWSSRGFALGAKSEHQESYNAFVKALEYRVKDNDKQGQAKMLASMGTACRYMGHFAKSLEHHQQAFDLNQALGNKQGMAAASSAMGNVYLTQGYRSANEQARAESNAKALSLFEQALSLGKESGDKRTVAMASSNRGLVLYEMGRLDEARKSHEETLAMSVEMKNPSYISSAQNNLGAVYEALSDKAATATERDSLLEVALAYYRQGYATRQELGQVDLITNSLTNIAALLHRMAKNDSGPKGKGMLAEALQLAEECYALTAESGNVSERNHAAETLSMIYETLGRYKESLEIYKEFIATRDSINSEDQRSELLRQELTYNFEKEELEKSKAYEQQLLEQRNQRNLLFAGGALLLVVILFLINGLRVRRKAALALSEKNKQVEAARAQAEKSERAKQQFLANMSHEIRTPMNAITGLSRLLLDKNLDSNAGEFVRAIHHSSENLMVVLNDILDQAKMEAGRMDIRNVAVDLHQELFAMRNVWRAKAQEKGLQMVAELQPELPKYVEVDAARLAQIMGNLLGNAVKFTDSGEVHLMARANGSMLEIAVRDTGPGISAEDLDKIFEPFKQSDEGSTRSKGGTGLGLSIAKQLAELMGGSLQASSKLGKGSVFTLRLPLVVASAEAVKTLPASITHEKNLHVLVAEDNDYNFVVTKETLLKYFPNAQVVRVANGEEAVDAVREDDYDLVFMDVHMPVMDGYEATARMRAMNLPTPIIGITASVLGSDIQKCLEVGMNGYVPKPFAEADFVRAVAEALKLEVSATEKTVRDEAREHELFLRFIPQRIAGLEQALESKDLKALRNLAHALRPQLANNGLTELEQLCWSIESAEWSVDWNAAVVLVDGLKEALKQRKV